MTLKLFAPRNLTLAALMGVSTACQSGSTAREDGDSSVVAPPEHQGDGGRDSGGERGDDGGLDAGASSDAGSLGDAGPEIEADAEVRHCDGKAVGSIEERTRYETDLVTGADECLTELQKRSCQSDGTWSKWSGEYTHESCEHEIDRERPCGDVAHGEQITQVRYREAEVPFGSQCVEEVQAARCTDGVLSPFEGEFSAETCSVAPAADCEGGKHGDLTTRERFESAEVPFEQECKKQTQTGTCHNGSWLFNGTFGAESCVVALPRDCEGGIHGEPRTRIAFRTNVVWFSKECESEVQTSTCHDGVWGPFDGTYGSEKCEKLPARACDGKLHGTSQTRTGFETAHVALGETCKGEPQERTCNDGTWTRWSGTYQEAACTVGKFCTDDDTGEVVDEEAYQTRTMYQYAFPETECTPEQQQRKCVSGWFERWSGQGYFNYSCAPLTTARTDAVSCRRWINGIPSCTEYTGLSDAEVNALRCDWGELDKTRGCPIDATTAGKCTGVRGVATETWYVYVESWANKWGRRVCNEDKGVWTKL